MDEKFDKVYRTDLCSGDGWHYSVHVYEDVTEIFMHEDGHAEERIGVLTAGYDLQVAEEIIRLRKQKQEDEKI